MAQVCAQCGKKIGVFSNSYLSIADDYVLCYGCVERIKSDFISLYSVDNFEEFNAIKKRILEYSTKNYNKKVNEEIQKYLNDYQDKVAKITGNYSAETNDEKPNGVNANIGPFENQDLVYTIDGVRGRHIDIYTDKVVITTKVTIGSLLTHNTTDGEKTIYYSDCIGVQFKQSKFAIGYLQLETASSNGNNKSSNFFAENSFTFSTTVISNDRMIEVADYVKSRVDAVKKGGTAPASTNNNNMSVADELLKFKQLLDMGILSQEEFDEQKNKLLNK